MPVTPVVVEFNDASSTDNTCWRSAASMSQQGSLSWPA